MELGKMTTKCEEIKANNVQKEELIAMLREEESLLGRRERGGVMGVLFIRVQGSIFGVIMVI